MRQVSKKVDVGGYSLCYQRFGEGRPTVVFDGGLGATIESFAKVAEGLQSVMSVCIYERAGMGQSDSAPQPRTSQNMVDDLHALLTKAHLPGPYVLVGHSIGGFNVLLFAHQYPQDTVGVVLVDAAHPDQWQRMLNFLPPESASDSDSLQEFREWIVGAMTDPMKNEEGMDLMASADQIRAIGHLNDLPLVVITAGLDDWEEDFPEHISRKIDEDWLRLQKELAELSKNSEHIIAKNSYHVVQDSEPELIIEAIQKLAFGENID